MNLLQPENSVESMLKAKVSQCKREKTNEGRQLESRFGPD